MPVHEQDISLKSVEIEVYVRRLAGSGQRAGSSPNWPSTQALRIGPSAGMLW